MNIREKMDKSHIQRMRKSKNCIGTTILDRQTCIKYITLVSSLIMQLYQTRDTSFGAFGTHFEEHFFSKLRRISKGDDRSDSFLCALISNLLLEELSDLLCSMLHLFLKFFHFDQYI